MLAGNLFGSQLLEVGHTSTAENMYEEVRSDGFATKKCGQNCLISISLWNLPLKDGREDQ